jgi:hypothetical protein
MIFTVVWMSLTLTVAQLAMGSTGLIVASLIFGITSRKPDLALAVGMAGLISSCVGALYLDSKLQFVVSKRMAGVFSLPAPWLFYVVVGLIGFTTAFLAFKVASTTVPKQKSGSSPKLGLSLVKDR